MHGAKYTTRRGQCLVVGPGDRAALFRWAAIRIAVRMSAERDPDRVGMASIWHNAHFPTVSRPFRAFFLFCCPPPAHGDAHTGAAPTAHGSPSQHPASRRQSMTTISSTDEIIADLRAGRMVILVDEEERENEGDLLMAAEFVTPDAINFMAKHGRGLICLTLTEERC